MSIEPRRPVMLVNPCGRLSLLGDGAQRPVPTPREHARKGGDRPFSKVQWWKPAPGWRVGVAGHLGRAALPHSMPSGEEVPNLLSEHRVGSPGVAWAPRLYLPVVMLRQSWVHSAQREPWAIVGCCVPVAFSLTGLSRRPRGGPMLTQGPLWRPAQGDSRLWGLGCRFQASGRSAGTMCVYLIRPIGDF